MTQLLSVEHLDKSYGDKQILYDINFEVNTGEVLVLLGPSGSGKSTLIRCLNGLEAYQNGTIFFQEQKVNPTPKTWQVLRQKIGMVFQSYDLFPNLSILDNITLGPTKVQKKPKDQAQKEALALLDTVDLADYAKQYPRELSGGKNSVSLLSAPWPCIPNSCCSMRSLPHWIRRWSEASWRLC